MTRRLIVTADDFGMSMEVNDAVEEAYRNGILTCASLVVAGDAAEDAVRRAKRLPKLGVGLHLAMFGAPASASEPSILAPDGANLGQSPVVTGVAVMVSPRARKAAEREFAAQFDAYRKTGLPLGHLDGHWHCHQHPAVLAIALRLGKPLGLRAVRIPYEPYSFSRDVGDGSKPIARLLHAFSHWPLTRAMRRRVRSAGMATNDRFFGKTDNGAIDKKLLLRLFLFCDDFLGFIVQSAGQSFLPITDFTPQFIFAALVFYVFGFVGESTIFGNMFVRRLALKFVV